MIGLLRRRVFSGRSHWRLQCRAVATLLGRHHDWGVVVGGQWGWVETYEFTT